MSLKKDWSLPHSDDTFALLSTYIHTEHKCGHTAFVGTRRKQNLDLSGPSNSKQI